MKKLIVTTIILCVTAQINLLSNQNATESQICKAGTGISFGRNPKIMYSKKMNGYYEISYKRDDGKIWKYKCKIEPNNIIRWASDSGNWRYDSTITYKIQGHNIYLEEKYDDGSVTKKTFPLKNIK